MSTDGPADRQRIGYVECVDLPDWGISGLRAKVDTGARSSALHVDSIEALPRNRVRFEVVLNRKSGRRAEVVAPITRVSRVKSSSGQTETRYFVRTTLRIGEVDKEIEISLASRTTMRFRMLLGRTAVSHDFWIDAGKRYANGKKPPRKSATPRSKTRSRRQGTRSRTGQSKDERRGSR